MKVVLFCGGFGMRLREYSETVPKPMVNIGYRPILWHVMRWYAHYGHKEFILCLGYRADSIKEYFLNYNECLSNDFTLSDGGRGIELLKRDIEDWKITFVDTGLTSNIGQRLKAVERHIGQDEVFLANYSDGLTDLQLPDLLRFSAEQRTIATFVAVQPPQSFHVVSAGASGMVESIRDVRAADLWINGGYFVLRRDIFKHIRPGEELVHEPFQRLIAAGQLSVYKHRGFFGCMDTFKEKQILDDLYARGEAPWEAWRTEARTLSLASANVA